MSSRNFNVSTDVTLTISSGDESYTAVSESSKYDLEAQCGWEQQRLLHMEN